MNCSKMTQNTLDTLERICGKLTFAKLIWSIRRCDDLSQVRFAEKLGISKNHLCDIERGRKNVSPRLAAVYAKKLGYPANLFVKLALQNIVDRDGLKFTVDIMPFKSLRQEAVYATA